MLERSSLRWRKNQHDEELLAVGVPARTLLANTDDRIEEAVQANFFYL